ncbi:Hypp4570 [Branchiostoma lanceolatum]|uniref:Hypp4570 protein n=1 Tax=Branchiostoma lanceolatum TaxID=7740 RepID=A0A8K0EYW2_BRALA|nr:Hypp4570 [Branchiostoma lanceolatum]
MPQDHNGECPLCSQAGRTPYNHFIGTCPYLPEEDRKYFIPTSLTRTWETTNTHAACYSDEEDLRNISQPVPSAKPSSFAQHRQVSRVTLRTSPHLEALHNEQSVIIRLASGEEFNNITADEANRLRLHIIPSTTQVQDQAGILGVCEATFHRQKLQLKFAAFVVTELASPIIAGRQFLEDNGLTINFATRQICFQDGSISSYPVLSKPHHPHSHRISDNFTRQHYTATNPVPNDFHMVTFPVQSDIYSPVSVKPCSPPVSSERVKDSPWDTDYKFNITGYTRAPTILGRPIHTIYDSHVTSAIPASPAEADTPASADANRQVKGENQPSPASADANRQVKGENQPSPASVDVNRQVKGETQPSPASADANRQVKGETQPSPVPLHQCSPTEGEAETKQTVEVYQHSPTQGITSTPQVKEGQHSNTDADTLRASEECKTLPPFPNTLQIQEKCQSSPKAAALSDTLQVQLLYQSPRDCPPAPPDHLDRQHPRDHPLPARAPDLPGYHHPAVRPPPEPPPRLLSQIPGHLRTHPQNFIS